MPRTKLTDAAIRKLPTDPDRTVLYRDTMTRGLALRVTKAGHKAFVLSYSIDGRERRMTLIDFPAGGVSDARKLANSYKLRIAAGQDPLAERDARRTAPTVADLWDYFSETHLPKVSQAWARDQRALWRNHVLPALGSRKLEALSSYDVDSLHRGVSRTAPTQANRVIASLRKALNLAKRREWVSKNVAIGVDMNPEARRERYLSEEELSALLSALDRLPNQQAANAIRLLLLTGARRSEVLHAQWSEFDLAKGVWQKPTGKVKSVANTRIPLATASRELLRQMKGEATTRYRFPKESGAPKDDIDHPWAWVKKEAGLEDFKLHDLRHSHASFLVSQGQSLAVIGRLLGHTQPQTTARYAHLMDSPLRAALEGMGATYTEARASSRR